MDNITDGDEEAEIDIDDDMMSALTTGNDEPTENIFDKYYTNFREFQQ